MDISMDKISKRNGILKDIADIAKSKTNGKLPSLISDCKKRNVIFADTIPGVPKRLCTLKKKVFEITPKHKNSKMSLKKPKAISTMCLKCNLNIENVNELTNHQCFLHQCLVCPTHINFKNSFLLQCHIKEVHESADVPASHILKTGGSAKKKVSERKYTCSSCHAEYQDKSDFNSHLSACKKKKKSKCLNCGALSLIKSDKLHCKRCPEIKNPNTMDEKNETENGNMYKRSFPRKCSETLKKNPVPPPTKSKKQKSLSSKVADQQPKSKKQKTSKTRDNAGKVQSLSKVNKIKDKHRQTFSSTLNNVLKNYDVTCILKSEYEKKIKLWCKRCGYGCISHHTLEEHKLECPKKLELMKKCSVIVKRLKPSDSMLSRIKREDGCEGSSSSDSAFYKAGDASRMVQPPQSYKCRNCSEAFDTLKSYEFHIEKKHRKMMTYVDIQSISNANHCPLCNTRFTTPLALRMHECRQTNMNVGFDMAQSNVSCGNNLPGIHSSVGFTRNVSSVPKFMPTYPYGSGVQGIGNESKPQSEANQQFSPLVGCQDQNCLECRKTFPQHQGCNNCSSCLQAQLRYQKYVQFCSNGSKIPNNNYNMWNMGKLCVPDDFCPQPPAFYSHHLHNLKEHAYERHPSEMKPPYSFCPPYFYPTSDKVNVTNVLPDKTAKVVNKSPAIVTNASSTSSEEPAAATDTAKEDAVDSEKSTTPSVFPVISDIRSLDKSVTDSKKADDDNKSSSNVELVPADTVDVVDAFTDHSASVSRFVCSKCYESFTNKSEFVKHYSSELGYKIDHLKIM